MENTRNDNGTHSRPLRKGDRVFWTLMGKDLFGTVIAVSLSDYNGTILAYGSPSLERNTLIQWDGKDPPRWENPNTIERA